MSCPRLLRPSSLRPCPLRLPRPQPAPFTSAAAGFPSSRLVSLASASASLCPHLRLSSPASAAFPVPAPASSRFACARCARLVPLRPRPLLPPRPRPGPPAVAVAAAGVSRLVRCACVSFARVRCTRASLFRFVSPASASLRPPRPCPLRRTQSAFPVARGGGCTLTYHPARMSCGTAAHRARSSGGRRRERGHKWRG